MQNIPVITTESLAQMLTSGEAVNIIDIRPMPERSEWFIPGSIHIDAYKKLKQNDASVFKNLFLDKKVPVVTVCAAGKTSLVAAEMLRQKGYHVFSLQNGMKGWSLAWNKASVPFQKFEIFQLRRTGKGCLSYIIVSNGEAIIADASLPAEVYKGILKENNWRLTSVIETHIHADHLSRSKQLADEYSVPLLLPVPNKVTFPYKALNDGQLMQLGKVTVKVVATPGHTSESVSFLINNEALISGDTLFTDSIGRPDLKADNNEARRRTELLYESVQSLMKLDDNVIVCPAHTNMPVDFDDKPVMATIAEIRNRVSMINLSKEAFVETVLSRLPPTPANFLTIAERNLTGDFANVNPVDLEAGANRCAVS